MKKEMFLSFCLACLVVAGIFWLIDVSEPPVRQPNHNTLDTQVKAYPSHQIERAQRASPANSNSNVLIQEGRVDQDRIIKCAANGKTIYSDVDCPTGTKTQQVQLHDTVGVVSPNKAVLAELTAQRLIGEQTYVQRVAKPASTTAKATKAECDAIDKHIEWLDAMGRQPQSAQMQDWIRQERQKARDRQFRMHC